MERTLAENQAQEQYRLLLEGFTDDNSLLDKASYIRSRIDTILRMAYAAKFPAQDSNLMKINQAAIIDALLPDKRHDELRSRLDFARQTLNTKAMHRYNLEKSHKNAGRDLTEDEYRDCLSAICDFIAIASGVPIPPPLLQARRTIRAQSVRDYSRLEIIFLIQLYSDIGQADDGTLILRQLRKMVRERDRIGLSSLSVKAVAYSPALTLMDFPAAGKQSAASTPSDSARALDTALDLMESAITRTEDLGGDKPWLMWLAHDISDLPDGPSARRLRQMMDDKAISFYPMALTEEAARQFTERWPGCGPKEMDPSLADNFFNKSVLPTVQEMHADTGPATD